MQRKIAQNAVEKVRERIIRLQRGKQPVEVRERANYPKV